MRAQNIILPYNPDGNNDQLIGVSDLQDLLAIYGTEFSAAVVSDDGSSAIVNLGNALPAMFGLLPKLAWPVAHGHVGGIWFDLD